MKNICDNCHNDKPILFSVCIYDKNFAVGTVQTKKELCRQCCETF